MTSTIVGPGQSSSRIVVTPNRQGNPVSHVTVRKEVGTFASLWNKWGVPQGLVSGPAPTRNLTYRKRKSKPPFQTWEQIERKVARGGLTDEEVNELWGSLFLTLSQITELLAHVKGIGRFGFIHPMFAFISEWVGHVTEEMATRYRHCFPNVARRALSSVFGQG